MKRCPFCAEEIQEGAIICRFCQRALAESSGVTVASRPHPISVPAILGLIGCTILFVGVFLPIVRLPIVGTTNYFQNGRGDGTVLLGLVAVSLLLIVAGRCRWLVVAGLPSLAMLVFTFVNLRVKLAEIAQRSAADLADNPFRGIADALTASVQLEWGWAVLTIGAVLLIASAITAGRSGRRVPVTAWIVAALVSVVVLGAAWIVAYIG
jgi:hypothetical protein